MSSDKNRTYLIMLHFPITKQSQIGSRKAFTLIELILVMGIIVAIKTGEIHALFFLPQGNWFNVARFSQLPQQSGIASREQSLLNKRIYTGYEDNVLPPRIQFLGSSMEVDSRDAQTLGEVKIDGDSIQPVLFYPDGTAQDATVYIQDNRRNRYAVVLRGLTGSARSVRVDQ